MDNPTHKLTVEIVVIGYGYILRVGTLLRLDVDSARWHGDFKAYLVDGLGVTIMLNNDRVAPVYDDGIRFRALIHPMLDSTSVLVNHLEAQTAVREPKTIDDVRDMLDAAITASGWKDE